MIRAYVILVLTLGHNRTETIEKKIGSILSAIEMPFVQLISFDKNADSSDNVLSVNRVFAYVTLILFLISGSSRLIVKLIIC